MRRIAWLAFWGGSMMGLVGIGDLPGQGIAPVAPEGFVLYDDMWLPVTEGVFTATAWSNGVVPYTFDAAVTNPQRNEFLKAMAEIEAVSDVAFLPRTSQANFIHIQPGPQANVSSSSVGMVGGQQAINVGANHWTLKYILVHEMYHALGFLHEQQRPDRDTYVTVNAANISQTACNGNPCNGNFTLSSGATPTGPYDYLSIMHYGQNAFSNGQGPTLTCANPSFQNRIGNRNYMTHHDAAAMAIRYGFPNAPVITSVYPSSVAAGSGETWILLSGANFFEGGDDPAGVIGSRVFFDFLELETVFINKNSVLGIIPESALTTVDLANSIRVRNDLSSAGGYSNSLNFAVVTHPCTSQGDQSGQAVLGIGDANGDGRGDYVVGAPGHNGAGSVWCYSGIDHQLIWSRTGAAGDDYGHSLAALGDTTGDGKSEVIVGSPGWSSNRGRAFVLDGATGATLLTLSGTITGEQYGWSVASSGDVNADGNHDVLIGAPYNAGGRVQVRSGTSGSIVYTIAEAQAGATMGYSVGGGLDVSGDGIPDFVVGVPGFDSSFLGEPAFTDRGAVRLYSGANGALLAARFGDGNYDSLGRSVLVMPPLNGSGNAQFAAGAPDSGDLGGAQGGSGYVRTYRGFASFNAYSVIHDWSGAATGDQYGQAIALAGDVDDDGFADLWIGATQGGLGAFATPTGPGYAQLRSGRSAAAIYQRAGSSSGGRFGWSVAGLGDSDGDGQLEALVGSPFSDVPCLNSGAFQVLHPPVPPATAKLLITEVSTFEPDGLEITNFGTSSLNLSGWTVIWRPTGVGSLVEVALPAAVLAPGEIAVVKEPGGVIAELPPSTQVFAVLPALSTSTQALVVGLRNPQGFVVDEVRTGEILLGVGGKFRGYSPDFQPGPFVGSRNHERLWGLDSNCGSDWVSNGRRTFGLENTGSGLGFRGIDPQPRNRVVINEVDDNPDYLEFYAATAVNMQGWTLLISHDHGENHQRYAPWPESYPIAAGGFFVLGDSVTAPAETPSGVPYRNVNSGGGSSFLIGTERYSIALYDSFGRLVDYVRSAGHDDTVAHNHPRVPSGFGDFMGAALRTSNPTGVLGRNGLQSDTNTSTDWVSYATRTMGSANGSGFTLVPSADPKLDVRAHSTRLGGGLTLILNAGEENEGLRWSFTFSSGHLLGTGPLLGLGADALPNYQVLNATPPWFGILDERGSARLDAPAGSVPPGIAVDLLFFLQSPEGALVQLTSILEWDS